MGIFNGLTINASGLALERLKLDTISANIANVNTNQTTDTEAYQKKSVQFSENLKNSQNGLSSESAGVKVTGIDTDDSVKLAYDPTNEAADENGYVAQSNVDMADEMVQMIQTVRTYEANVSASEMNKTILKKALEISKG
ncbi:flagellar basal body rod protein FlgC [Enterococcus sp.]|uniref:flagellar basal body rod protein FlgC n=1 Tax=Enterococcus sp. TaxID=35783 RepID=UPI0028A1C3C0|nr:flagellar basal body rod protein FlgC [Enterococcus sp.]